MELIGADADFRAEAEFAAVVEAGGGVPKDGGGVDAGEEGFGGLGVVGDDGVGVVGAVGLDVVDGFIEAGDDFDGEDEVEIFCGPVLGGREGFAEEAGGFGFAEEADALSAEGGGEAGEEGGGDGAVDEEGFGGVAGAGALGFGVEGDGFGEGGVGFFVDVDVADAVEVFEDGHAGVGDDGFDEAVAAAGDEEIDPAVHAAEGGDGFAVGGGDDGAGGGGKAGGLGGGAEAEAEGLVGVEGFLAAAEDDGVAGFEAEDGGIDCDVRAGLVDDADDADGDADFTEGEAVGEGPGFEGFSDGVGEGDDVVDALDHGVNALGGELESVEHGGGEAGGAAGLKVEAVGGGDGGALAVEFLGEGVEEEVFLVGGGGGEGAGGEAGLAAEGFEGVLEVGHGAIEAQAEEGGQAGLNEVGVRVPWPGGGVRRFGRRSRRRL